MDSSFDTDDTGGAVRSGGRRSSSTTTMHAYSTRRATRRRSDLIAEAVAAPFFEDEDRRADEEEGAEEEGGEGHNDDEEDDEEDEEDDEEEDDEDGRTVTGGSQEGDAASSTANNNGDSSTNTRTNATISAVSDLKSLEGLRELGPEAVCWQLSSAKPGNGVEQIRDPSLETYWQSDGQTQPHWIQVHFARRVAISHVCLYLDYSLDESYTPKKIAVDAGMTHQDLQQAVPETDLTEPSGWVILPLRSPPDPLDDFDDVTSANKNDEENHDNETEIYNNKSMVRAHLVRISIHAMHQNGRDTHVRQVRLYGPRSIGGLHHHGFGPVGSSMAMVDLPALSPAGNNNVVRGQRQKPTHSAIIMEDPWADSSVMVDSIHATQFTTIR